MPPCLTILLFGCSINRPMKIILLGQSMVRQALMVAMKISRSYSRNATWEKGNETKDHKAGS